MNPKNLPLKALSVVMSGRKYKASSDPLASWGVLRNVINTLTAAKLKGLLRRELSAEQPRGVILRALTGRINALARGDGTRGPRAYHAQIGAKLGLPSRKVVRKVEETETPRKRRAKA